MPDNESAVNSIRDHSETLLKMFMERFSSPMYFYFGIAWIITNWDFVYAFFFTDQSVLKDLRQITKVEYLIGFYQFSFWSFLKLFVIPAISAYIAVWWLSRISEEFFRKYESYKINKRTILRELDYAEKVAIARRERKIRDSESDKKEVRYEDNDEFNTDFDDNSDIVRVAWISMRPSEVLYNTDYEAYKEQLQEWMAARQ